MSTHTRWRVSYLVKGTQPVVRTQNIVIIEGYSTIEDAAKIIGIAKGIAPADIDILTTDEL